MDFKKIFIVSCFLIAILLFGAVSAGDNNASDILNSDEADLNQLSNNEILSSDEPQTGSFDDLANKINQTQDTLILDKNYTNSGNENQGILINKSITIDGEGHTLNGNKTSRIFYITADNVTLKNINFINGLGLGSYNASDIVGGGAIYWSGSNGKLINCTFTNNQANGLLYDPYAEVEEVIDLETGIGYTIDWPSMRPAGASTNRGGAIHWTGSNAFISDCEFKLNSVGYPDNGGAIFMTSENALIESSRFFKNSAWNGEAIYYSGKKLIINSSFINETSNYGHDTSGIAGVNFTLINAVDDSLKNSTETSTPLKDSDNASSVISVKPKIVNNKNLITYFKSGDKFTVTVYGDDGKLATGKEVTFTVDNSVIKVKTDKKGVASLKLTQHPGKYSITSEFSGVKVKNTITIKSRLITSDLTKKVKKSANFKVKVLNAKGKVFAKQTVKIKFNGKTYSIKTNSKGIATLKLPKNIKAGKYTIKTTYLGLTNTNKVTVKK